MFEVGQIGHSVIDCERGADVNSVPEHFMVSGQSELA